VAMKRCTNVNDYRFIFVHQVQDCEDYWVFYLLRFVNMLQAMLMW
jgi:hypothetical protein